MKIFEPWRLASDDYATEPALVTTARGALVLAWAQRDATGREQVAVRHLGALDALGQPSAPGPERTLEDPGQCCWPSPWRRGDGVGVAWAALDQRGQARLMGTTLDASLDPEAPPQLLRQGASIRRVATAATRDGVWMVYERDDDHGHHVEALWWSPGQTPTVVPLDGDPAALRCRPAVIARPDGSALAVWEAHEPGRVVLRGAWLPAPGGGARALGTLVGDRGFCQAPALSWDAQGRAWLAFNTDAGDQGAPTLARWVGLRRLSLGADGALLALEAPLAPPPGRTLEANGEDQSLEFPAVGLDPAGGLWVAARASHNMRIQGFGDGPHRGWGPMEPLEPVMWGCRGTRLTVVTLAPGRLAVAYHGRRGIQVMALEVEPMGPPEDAAMEAALPSPDPPAGAAPKPARPAWALTEAPWHPYWGDIHFHSAHSDGVGTVEEAYLRCRDRYAQDFACLTEHDAFIGRRVTDAVWRMMVETSEAFNRPEEGFATLIGIEYTGPRYPGPGHKCLYFDDADAPVVCRWDGLEEPERLLARVGQLGGIAIPHHVGWLGGDPEHHDPELQPCWEVCSTHGQYEAPMDDVAPPPLGHRLGLEEHQEALRDHFIRRRLEDGQRFGFVGGSDGHGLLWHHGVGRKADSHTTGLTGVWAPRLGRAEVLAAIRARRTWCTSGAMMALAFTIDGHPQGSIIPPLREALEVSIALRATTPWREVIVLGHTPQGTRPLARWTQGGDALDFRRTVSIPTSALRTSSGFLYVRASQADHECAWASPCFWP